MLLAFPLVEVLVLIQYLLKQLTLPQYSAGYSPIDAVYEFDALLLGVLDAHEVGNVQREEEKRHSTTAYHKDLNELDQLPTLV